MDQDQNVWLHRAGLAFTGFVMVSTCGPHPWSFVFTAVILFLHECPDFAQLWAQLSTTYPVQYFILGIFPAFILTYWVHGFWLLIIEYPWPSFPALAKLVATIKRKYKVQKAKHLQMTPELLKKVVLNLLIGQFCVALPLIAFGAYLAMNGKGMHNAPQLPGPWRMSIDFLIFVLVNDVLFFYSHWLMHAWGWGYRTIHKIHHQFPHPCGLVAAYCHPAEMLLCNLLPLGVGLVVARTHAFTAMVWAACASMGTQTHHAGYRFPWQFPWDNQPEFHDYHHEAFHCNYGMSGYWDLLHGTDAKFRELCKKGERGRLATRKEVANEKKQ